MSFIINAILSIIGGCAFMVFLLGLFTGNLSNPLVQICLVVAIVCAGLGFYLFQLRPHLNRPPQPPPRRPPHDPGIR